MPQSGSTARVSGAGGGAPQPHGNTSADDPDRRSDRAAAAIVPLATKADDEDAADVASANSIFGVNAAGAGFQWNGRNWDALPIPMPLEQIAIGSDGSIALRSRSGDATLFGRNLSEMKPLVQDRVIVDVAVGNKDTVYFIDANGDLFRWGGETGKIGGSLGKFTKVSAASDGTVWAVNGQGQMFKLENL